MTVIDITTRTGRDAYIDGLHELGDWLREHPDVQAPCGARLMLPLHSNAAVREFADGLGKSAEVVYDGEGNARLDLCFGPIIYHAYGYADYKEHCERLNAAHAEQYAKDHGLALVPVDGQVPA